MGAKVISLLGKLLLFSLICTSIAGSSSADEPGWIPISGSVVITEPGSYFLAGDITGCGEPVCINITCGDVLLDGREHRISGIFQDHTTGVSAGAPAGDLLENVSVTNISVSGFENGIYFTRVRGGVISRNVLTRNARGISVEEVSDIFVAENNASGQIMYGAMNGAGLVVARSNRNTFIQNTLNENGLGGESEFGGHGILAGDSSSGNTFAGNTILGNQQTGVKLEGSCTGNTIFQNSIAGNHDGILIFTGSDDNEILENVIRDNREFGIVLDQTSGNCLESNAISGNRYNFFVTGASHHHYLHDIDTSNTVNGRSVFYLVNVSGISIGPGQNPGVIYAIDCREIRASDVILEQNGVGTFFLGSSRLILENLTCRRNGVGVTLDEGCDSVVLSRVHCTENDGFGILVSNGSNVTIEHSSASFNTIRGLLMQGCSDILIANTSASHNAGPGILHGIGIDIEDGKNISLVMTRTSRNLHHGIWVSGMENLVIRDGVSDENDQLGLVAINSENVLVYGMRFAGNAEAGMGVMGLSNGTIANNYFNNAVNVDVADPGATATSWNMPKAPGPNIVGGPYLGGNYWAKPDGTGWSEVTPDRGDGFCTAPFVIDDDNVDSLPLHVRTAPPFYADFTAHPLSGYPPLSVQFTDASDGNTMGCLYRFGDGFMSTARNPVHTYQVPGNYTVSLTIWKTDGWKMLNTTTTRVGYIRVEKEPEPEVRIDFSASPRSGRAPLTVSFAGSSSVRPILWKYSFGDGSMAAQQNPTHTYRRPGNYTVNLTVWMQGAKGIPVIHTLERVDFITVT